MIKVIDAIDLFVAWMYTSLKLGGAAWCSSKLAALMGMAAFVCCTYNVPVLSVH